MGYSKRQFISAAFEEIGMAEYVFDLQPEQLQSALNRLDAMLAEWNAKGLRLGYSLPSSPQDSDLDEPTFAPDSAWEAIITNLAIRIAPGYGKAVSPDTKVTAKAAYNTLLQRAAFPLEQQLPETMPTGQGNKPWRWDNPFVPRPVDPVDAGPDGPIEWS
jgi:hypothetical protein